MKELIKKWLDIPTREELEKYIERKTQKQVDRRYAKLKKADKDRYRNINQTK